MSDLIQKLISDGDLVLWHDYRSGCARDWSGNGNDGILIDVQWTNNGLRFLGDTGEVQVPDSAELQGSEFCLVTLFDNFIHDIGRILCKRDTGGTNWDWYTTAGGLSFYDGTTTRSITKNFAGKKYLAINFSDGNTPESFSDGISDGNYSGTVSISADDADVHIGNNWVSSAALNTLMQAATVINRELTATEHAQLYGELASKRWPKKFYSISNAHIQVNPNESGLVVGYDMIPRGDKVIDLSPEGNDGTISGPHHERTVLGDTLRFVDSSDVVTTPYTATPSTFTISGWFNPESQGGGNYARVFQKGANRIELFITASDISMVLRYYDGGAVQNISLFDCYKLKMWNHFAVLVGGGSIKAYINNVLKGNVSDSVVLDSQALRIGNDSALTRLFDGRIAAFQWIESLKDEAWVTTEYQKGRRALWHSDWAIRESDSNVTAGPLEGSPFWVNSGSLKVSLDTIPFDADPSPVQLLDDWNMEDVDTAAYSSTDATLSKQTTDPYEGIRLLRITADVGAGAKYPRAYQAPLVVGEWYLVDGVARSDGNQVPRVFNSGTELWVGDTLTTWQRYRFLFQATSTNFNMRFVITDPVGTEYVEFDAVKLQLIPKNVKVIECLTAGICYVSTSYFHQTPTEAAYGTWEFNFYRAAASSSTIVSFISTEPAYSDATNDGYVFYQQVGGNTLVLGRVDNGGIAAAIDTYAGVAVATHYRIRITRTSAGIFTVYIIGGVFSDWTEIMSGTDTTYSESKYIGLNLIAGDKIAYSDVKGEHSIIKGIIV